jgi:hypothetical protein
MIVARARPETRRKPCNRPQTRKSQSPCKKMTRFPSTLLPFAR